MLKQTSLQNDHVMAAEWEKAENLQELDISATDLSKDCLMDILPRIPAIKWISMGQLDGLTDNVFKVSFEMNFKQVDSQLFSLLALDGACKLERADFSGFRC